MRLSRLWSYKPSFSEIHEYTMDLGKLHELREKAKLTAKGQEIQRYDTIIECAQEVLLYLLRKEKS